jgi:hypothetical protein
VLAFSLIKLSRSGERLGSGTYWRNNDSKGWINGVCPAVMAAPRPAPMASANSTMRLRPPPESIVGGSEAKELAGVRWMSPLPWHAFAGTLGAGHVERKCPMHDAELRLRSTVVPRLPFPQQRDPDLPANPTKAATLH